MRKQVNTNMAAVLLSWETNMADMTSCVKDSLHFFGFILALSILLVFRKESRTDVTRKDLCRNLTLPLLIVAIMKIPKEIQIFVV